MGSNKSKPTPSTSVPVANPGFSSSARSSASFLSSTSYTPYQTPRATTGLQTPSFTSSTNLTSINFGRPTVTASSQRPSVQPSASTYASSSARPSYIRQPNSGSISITNAVRLQASVQPKSTVHKPSISAIGACTPKTTSLTSVPRSNPGFVRSPLRPKPVSPPKRTTHFSGASSTIVQHGGRAHFDSDAKKHLNHLYHEIEGSSDDDYATDRFLRYRSSWMQKNEDSDVEEEADVKREIKIDPRYHGILIGTNGKNVKSLRDRFPGVAIRFPARNSQSDVVEISGERRNVNLCFDDLQQQVAHLKEVHEYEDSFYAWKYKKREILGFHGSNINRIRSETGIQITLKDVDDNFVTVALVGNRAKVLRAKSQLAKFELTHKASFVERFFMFPHSNAEKVMQRYSTEIDRWKFQFDANLILSTGNVGFNAIGTDRNVSDFVDAFQSLVEADRKKREKSPANFETASSTLQSLLNPNSVSAQQFETNDFDQNGCDTHLSSVNSIGACELFVGSIPMNATESELRQLFQPFGIIHFNGVVIVRKPNPRNVYFGFIRFANLISAANLFESTLMLKGSRLEVTYSKNGSKNLNGREMQSSCRNQTSGTVPVLYDQNNAVENCQQKSEYHSADIDSSQSSHDFFSIKVSHVPCGVRNAQLFHMFKKYGEFAQPAVVKIHDNGGTNDPFSSFCVNFVSVDSVTKVLAEKHRFYIKRCKIFVSKTLPSAKNAFVKDVGFNSTNDEVEELKAETFDDAASSIVEEKQFFIVKLENLPDKISKRQVLSFLKGHGRIQQPPGIRIDFQQHQAFVPFESLEQVRKLIERFKGVAFLLNQKVKLSSDDLKNLPSSKNDATSFALPFKVASFEKEVPGQQEEPSEKLTEEEALAWEEFIESSKDNWNRGIVVRNIRNLTKGLLEMYFRNHARSSGGPYSSFIIQEKYDRAIFIYSNEGTAEKVVGKSSHHLESKPLLVSKLPQLRMNGFSLYNIPAWITKDGLEDYLGARIRCRASVRFHSDDTSAVVHTDRNINLEEVRKEFEKRRLESEPMSCANDEMVVSPMISCKAIIIDKDASSTGNKLEKVLHLEQALKRTFSVEADFIEHIFANEAKSMTLIIFKNSEYVDCVLKDKECEKFALPFYDELGWVSKQSQADFVRQYAHSQVFREIEEFFGNIIKTDVGKLVVQEELDKMRYQCVWNVDPTNTQLRVVAIRKDIAEEIVSFILSLCSTTTFDLDEQMLAAWTEQDKLVETLEKEIGAVYHLRLNGSCLQCATLARDSNKIKGLVDNFFAVRVKTSHVLKKPANVLLYLQKFCLRKLTAAFNELLFVQSISVDSISVFGTKSDFTKFAKEVNKVTSELKFDQVRLAVTGMSSFFLTDAGKAEVEFIADRSGSLLSVIPENGSGSSKIVKQAVRKRFKRHFPTSGVNVSAPSSVQINLLKCNIVDVNCDVIVNSTGKHPLSSGALSAEVFKRAGTTVQNEIKEKYPNGLLADVLAVTSGGKLHCKRILHAVCEDWESSEKSIYSLRMLIKGCLYRAMVHDSLAHSSISIPALGTGNRGYPSHIVAKVMFATVHEYFALLPPIHKTNRNFVVNFVIDFHNDKVYRNFEAEMVKYTKNQQQHQRPTKDASFETELAISVIFESICDTMFEDIKVNGENVTDQIRFEIVGTKEQIEKAKTYLNDFVLERSVQSKMSFSHKFVAQLDADQISYFQSKAQERGLKISLQQSPTGKVEICGFQAQKFGEKLEETFERLLHETSIPDNPTHHWYQLTKPRYIWKLFNPLDDARLDREFSKNDGRGQVEMMFSNCVKSTVNFDSMCLIPKGHARTAKSTSQVLLKRKAVNSSIPIEWELNEKSTEPFKLVGLDIGSAEYKSIKDLVASSFSQHDIFNIQRVENVVKFGQYSFQKEKVENTLPVGFEAEKLLFYSLDDESQIKEICTGGFDRNVVEIDGRNHLFGQGCEFHSQLVQSWSSKTFVVKVLTGDFVQGSPEMKAAPLKPTGSAKQYDSVVDDFQDPSVYVVFSDNHAYPAYLITHT